MSCCRSTLDSVKICYEAWNYHVCIFRDTNNMRSPWQKFQKLAQAPLKAPPMLCLIPLTQLTGKKLAKLESERCLFGCLFVFMCIFHMHKRDVSSHIPSPSKKKTQTKQKPFLAYRPKLFFAHLKWTHQFFRHVAGNTTFFEGGSMPNQTGATTHAQNRWRTTW